MRARTISDSLIILLAAACSICSAHTVYLTSGEQLTGTVIEEHDEIITFEPDDGGVIRIEKRFVKKIECTAIPDAEKAIARAQQFAGEAEDAIKRNDYNKALLKLNQAAAKCKSVSKHAGALSQQSSTLCLEYTGKIKSLRGLVLYEGKHVSPEKRAESIMASAGDLERAALKARTGEKYSTALEMYSDAIIQYEQIGLETEEVFGEAQNRIEFCKASIDDIKANRVTDKKVGPAVALGLAFILLVAYCVRRGKKRSRRERTTLQCSE